MTFTPDVHLRFFGFMPTGVISQIGTSTHKLYARYTMLASTTAMATKMESLRTSAWNASVDDHRRDLPTFPRMPAILGRSRVKSCGSSHPVRCVLIQRLRTDDLNFVTQVRVSLQRGLNSQPLPGNKDIIPHLHSQMAAQYGTQCSNIRIQTCI